MINFIPNIYQGITQQGANLNLVDVLSINIDGTEYYLTMNVEGKENYISMN